MLRHLGGIEQYGLLSMGLFGFVFIGVLVWALRQTKPHLERMARAPLETEFEEPCPPLGGGHSRVLGSPEPERRSPTGRAPAGHARAGSEAGAPPTTRECAPSGAPILAETAAQHAQGKTINSGQTPPAAS